MTVAFTFSGSDGIGRHTEPYTSTWIAVLPLGALFGENRSMRLMRTLSLSSS